MNTCLQVQGMFVEELEQEEVGKIEQTAVVHEYAVAAVMNGRAASPGMAVGRAVIVKSKKDMARVGHDSIVVSGNASPDLSMVMDRARAIAAERGGQLATASGLARAFGIPAAVGVENLLDNVREGDLVRVDGTKGTVEVIAVAA